MYRRFRDRFGAAGVAIGVIALVMALITGAYAAGGGLSGKQKKEVKKIAQQYAGKDGAPGAPGTNGTNGKDGLAGAAGPTGPAGPTGKTGATGATGAPGAAGATGAIGATGATGAPGQSGFTETLPSGKTETGVWGGGPTSVTVEGTTYTAENGNFPISFTIPLAQEIDESHTILVPFVGTVDAHCDNGAGPAPGPGNPEADPGYLCVFQSGNGPFVTGEPTSVAKPQGGAGAAVNGATVFAVAPGPVLKGLMKGSWAVTAP